MKARLPLILVVVLAAAFHLAGAQSSGGLELWDVPKFNGYMGVGNDVRFALTPYAIDRKLAVNLSWVRIGQKIGAYEVVSFDAKTEVLKLRKPGFESIEVRLVEESKVRNAAFSPGVSREAARNYALELVASYLRSVREEHPERSVTVNPDIALMPEDQRAKFLASRKKMEANGQFLTPFISADGRWGRALSGDEAGKLPPGIGDNLSAEDRREINQAWALARAEEIARSIPPRVAKPAK